MKRSFFILLGSAVFAATTQAHPCDRFAAKVLQSVAAQTAAEKKTLKASAAKISEFTTNDNEKVVQYFYSAVTVTGKDKSVRKMVARITLSKSCHLLVASTFASVEDMEADDLEAAQGGFSE